jgi:hypothetical protein
MINIQTILDKHIKYLKNEKGGECAYLRGADLQDADLRGADLQDADLRGADLQDADLRDANLRDANLRDADLRDANLRDANWDYSVGFTLSCRGSRFTCSLQFIYQNLAHLCTLKVDKSDQVKLTEILDKIRPYALMSHRAGDLGLKEEGCDKRQKEAANEIPDGSRDGSVVECTPMLASEG